MSRQYFFKAFVLLQFILSSANLLAQNDIFPYKHIEHITNADGLSNNNVFCILQDKHGFMWFLTFDGLNRYDGYSFKSYRYSPDHPDYIRPGWFTAMVQDSSGIIWIGDNTNGIFSFDPVFEKFIHYKYEPGNENSLSDDQTQCIVTGTKNNIWIPTRKGLNEFNTRTGKFKSYFHKEGDPTTISNDFVTSVCSDEDGNFWIATASPGVDYFNPETGKVMQHYNYGSTLQMTGDATSGIYQINKGNNGNIWINSIHGLTCFNTRTKTARFFKYPGNVDAAATLNAYMSILEDSKNNLWIPKGKDGLDFYNYASGANYHLNIIKPMAMNVGATGCVFEDNNHKIWIGTEHGIFTIETQSKKFNVYQHDDSDKNTIQNNWVFAFFRDSRGVFYIGNKGVDIATDNFKKFKPFSLYKRGKENMEHSLIWDIYEDSKKVLWFATNNGLMSYIPETTERKWYTYDSRDSTSVSAQSVTGIIEDREGRYWCATFGGGLNSFDPATGKFRAFEKHEGENSISTNSIGNLFMDSRGMLYMMSWDGGLIIFNPDTEKFKIYRHDAKDASFLSCDIVTDFVETKNKIIWISTMGGGINAFDPATGKFRAFTTKDGLPDNSITGMVEDNNGKIWLTTTDGISCFTPPQEVFNEKNKFSFRNYNMSDGLPAKAMNGDGYYKDKDGTIFIGTETAGFISFKPEELKDNDFIPPAYITNLKLFNNEVKPGSKDSLLKKSIEFTKTITLDYTQNDISFEFAALNYFHPEKNGYQYKLENYNDDWITTDASRRFANYTNLNPGKYIFKVKASNNDGKWNNIPTEIEIIITPPFWQTWWFKTLIALAAAGIVYGIYRYRLKQVLRLQNIRNRIAADLHDDIGSTLNSISVYSEVAKNDPEQRNISLSMIGESSRKVIDAMSDIVWTINPDNDNFEKVILRMRSLAYNLLRAKNIEFTFKADESLNNLKLSLEKRRNFYLIFKETINNLIKYSQAKRVQISLNNHSNTITLVVRDDGIGFDATKKYNGNGLTNIRKRAKEMNAELNIESGEEIGTSTQLIFTP